MKITKLNIKGNYRYLWLKYVNGINLNTHCAKSLLGDYSKLIKSSIKEYNDIVLNEYEDYKFIYLCGVSVPFNWEANIHTVLVDKKGSKAIYEDEYLYIEVEDAELLENTFDITKCDHTKAKFKTYNTCRNWQYAYVYRDLFKED